MAELSKHNKTLICVVGPTAVGKTTAAIEIAAAFQTVILSADSRQFYKEMSIGTAKPNEVELAAVPHYFINSHTIADNFSAGDYEREALTLLDSLFEELPVVVLVGGSGLFINALCQGLDDLPSPLPGIREKWNSYFEENGIENLQKELNKVDPEYFALVDQQNPQRLIRALEVYESTGKPFSSYRKNQLNKRDFDIITIGLNMDREKLYERINLRVDHMMEAGLLQEVESLFSYKNKPALQTVGYSELFDYLEGNIALNQAVDKVKQNTRRYAKRQITWFKKNTETHWFEPHDIERIILFIREKIKKK